MGYTAWRGMFGSGPPIGLTMGITMFRRHPTREDRTGEFLEGPFEVAPGAILNLKISAQRSGFLVFPKWEAATWEFGVPRA